MEAIFEVLFEIIFEVVLEVIAQILVEAGFEALSASFRDRKEINPFLAITGYILFGLILGSLSLLIFPDPIIKSPLVKTLNFIFSPLLVGFSLCLFSWLLERKKLGEGIFKIEKFIFGCFFALSYSIIRIIFTN
jgi:hypothetical protein